MRTAARFLPALLAFPPAAARQDAWGRLVALTSGGAVLSTGACLRRGEDVLVSFELGGDRFESLSARVAHAEDDADGHVLAELRWRDEAERRRLAKALTDVLARS